MGSRAVAMEPLLLHDLPIAFNVRRAEKRARCIVAPFPLNLTAS